MRRIVDSTSTEKAPLDLGKTLAALMRYIPQSDRIDELSAKLAQRPAQNTLMILGASALLFYIVERQENPKVDTIYDALEYCSSSLSVGYTNIYPQTPIGKMVATLLMTYGPALSGAMIDGPRKSRADEDVMEQKILSTLEEILVELRRRPE
jgi:hypothetical protein